MNQEDRKEAAVSETLGYILLFAIVMVSMGVIYVVGYPILQTNMESNIFESAEQSFVVLKSNMDRVAFDQTPVKVLKMKLQSSSIGVTNQSSVTIIYDGNTVPVETGEIVFQKGNKKLTYEAGAVFKSYTPGSAVIVSKPSVYVTSSNNINTTTIGLVALNGNDYSSGKGIAKLSLHYSNSILKKSPSTTDVTLKVDSPHASKWEEYLSDTGFTISNTTDSTVTAYMNNTMLILSIHEVDVEIE